MCPLMSLLLKLIPPILSTIMELETSIISNIPNLFPVYLEISENYDIILSKVDPKFKTLAPGKWISNFVLDDVLLGMLQISKLEQNILYLGHYHYGLLNSCDYGPILEFLSNSNVVSRDLIVVLITNVSSNSADHCLLGAISLKLKTVELHTTFS